METNVEKVCVWLLHQFKSYYVVWKPFADANTTGQVRSLNRTMQYGNACREWTCELECAGLNRTMQYGNTEM